MHTKNMQHVHPKFHVYKTPQFIHTTLRNTVHDFAHLHASMQLFVTSFVSVRQHVISAMHSQLTGHSRLLLHMRLTLVLTFCVSLACFTHSSRVVPTTRHLQQLCTRTRRGKLTRCSVVIQLRQCSIALHAALAIVARTRVQVAR